MSSSVGFENNDMLEDVYTPSLGHAMVKIFIGEPSKGKFNDVVR